MSKVESSRDQNLQNIWMWKLVKENLCSDLLGIYMQYSLPDAEEVKTSFEKVLDSIRKLIICEHCGKVHSSVFRHNLFISGFTVCEREPKNENVHVGGFLRPTSISCKMRKFLEMYGPLPRLVLRRDVTRIICTYIKDNHLYDDNDKRIVLPDEQLANVLDFPPDGSKELNYFRLQIYIRPHMIPIGELSKDYCNTYPMFRTSKDRSKNSGMSMRSLKSSAPVCIVKKNKFNNYEHEKTGFLFNGETRKVYGKQRNDGSVAPLTAEDAEVCYNIGFEV